MGKHLSGTFPSLVTPVGFKPTTFRTGILYP